MDFRITKRTALLLFFDIAATYAAYWLASLLTDVVGEVFYNNEIYFMIGILALINVLVLGVFHLYNNLWEYASVDEAIQIVLAVALSTFVGAVFLWIIDVRLPIRVFFVALFLLIFFCGGMRMVYRVARRKKRAFTNPTRECDRLRTLIVGAGETGSLTIDRMASKDPLMPGIPIVAVDDDPAKRRLRIHGVKVEGTSDDILDLVDKYDIEQIVVAIPSSTLEERRRIFGICTKTDCKLRTLPNIRELRIDELGDVSLRDVDVADLLGREEIVLNTRTVSGYIAGETVLVTGGGGSIGSELARQLCKVAPARIVIFDMYENDAYMLRNELLSEYDDIDIVIEVGSVCDIARINEVFAKYRPGAVFHAAAHKHVPLMEVCPREAMQNNVFGTLNTVRAADAYGADRFIFISTDKAVNPTSVMGATKRLGEMVVQYYARTSKTVFSAVRFGNVLGSNGSVIPVFKRQIAAGGPVTVTHPDIERFFMTIPEASRLVIQAGGLAKGGEIFILDMGEPVKIVELAKSLIQLSGLTPDADIEIVFTGLREGEKLFEELLMDEESTLPTTNSSIMISTGQEISYDEVAAKLDEIEAAIAKTDAEAIAILEEAVPTYTHTTNRG
ncbi:nucleoside-diphosphate sugar epimerase/dehydratase [Raoultibacter phocaeensis]|uniref:nucleoside-diphosphate sugar epimerase/dehydratase n=1 Tax=Raoultibacter phocaeensis TaxID=2479841 RepID=UPI00111A204C|nr:nucleoside-diphosphate sugar epimerase/dehydratase [Raoultibacter phocaeensis]